MHKAKIRCLLCGARCLAYSPPVIVVAIVVVGLGVFRERISRIVVTCTPTLGLIGNL